MASPPTARFLPLADVAEILSISMSQAYALVRRGDLRAIRIGGRGQWRVEKSELEAFIKRSYEAADEDHGASAADPDEAADTEEHHTLD
ncbi:MAG: helix-turn-helix domain-containing protein [Nocardioidaceae bacterium]